jgi:hypothetical protein
MRRSNLVKTLQDFKQLMKDYGSDVKSTFNLKFPGSQEKQEEVDSICRNTEELV